MQIEQHKSLKHFNTFGIDCTANYFVAVHTIDELKKILSNPKFQDPFILGGGSNMLLRSNSIENLVLHVNLKGISVEKETEEHVFIKAMAGENWHEFVLYCIEHNYGGLENLSLIPGNVGTAPIQNIGAYGVELKDVFEYCDTMHIETQTEKRFTKAACKFGYRDSVFKNELKGQYIITSVTFKLTKKNHRLQTSYGAITDKLKENGITEATITAISEAVIAIRNSKLPNPKELGNSGSFFKNPVLSVEQFKAFSAQFPEAPFYEVSPTQFKVPAGWLIEKAGFKGKRFGDAGVHKNQALVLVNYDSATGKEIWDLALKIQETVKKKFGIHITPEVNVI